MATTVLSGGSGTTNAALLKKIVRRLGDRPWEDRISGSLLATTPTVTVAVTDGTKYQAGFWLDWLEDETLDQGIVESISANNLTVRRPYRGATAQTHSANSIIRVRPRIDLQAATETIDDVIQNLWPEIYLVSEEDYTINAGDTPAKWFSLPADVEDVLYVYQKRDIQSPTPVDLIDLTFSGPHFVDSTLSATKKALRVEDAINVTDDSKMHAITISKCAISNLTSGQIRLVLYEAAAEILATQFAAESQPERRSGLEGAPDAGKAFQLFKSLAAETRAKEAQRLREFLPRRQRPEFRGGRAKG